MTTFIRESELRQVGSLIPWGLMSWQERQRTAAVILRARGDSQTAFLVEINNPIANASFVYVKDIN